MTTGKPTARVMLKPCPFCGRAAELVGVGAWNKCSAVYCDNCEIYGPMMATKETGAYAWNRRSQGNDAAGDVPAHLPWKARGTSVYFANVAGGFDVRGCPDPVKLAEFIAAACNSYASTASPDVRAQGEVPSGVLGYMYRRVNGPTYFSLPDPRPLANTDIAQLEWFTPVCALLQRQSDTEPKADDAWQPIESAPIIS